MAWLLVSGPPSTFPWLPYSVTKTLQFSLYRVLASLPLDSHTHCPHKGFKNIAIPSPHQSLFSPVPLCKLPLDQGHTWHLLLVLNIGESNKHWLKQWNNAKLLSEDNPGFVSRDTYGPRGKAKLPVTLAKPRLLAFSAFLVGCSHLCLSGPKTCAWPSTSNTDCQPLRLCPHVNPPSGSNYKPNTQTPNNTKNSQPGEGTFRENSLVDTVSIHPSQNFVEVSQWPSASWVTFNQDALEHDPADTASARGHNLLPSMRIPMWHFLVKFGRKNWFSKSWYDILLSIGKAMDLYFHFLPWPSGGSDIVQLQSLVTGTFFWLGILYFLRGFEFRFYFYFNNFVLLIIV